MSHFDSCQLTLIWFAHITLNYRQPTDGTVWRSFVFMLNWQVWHIISAYMLGKNDWSFIWARVTIVTIVSGCLILTAVNLIILIQMAYINERQFKLCKIYCDIWHLLTSSVCRVGVSVVITKFSRMDSLPNFVTHGAPLRALRARESSARNKRSDRLATREKASYILFSAKTQIYKQNTYRVWSWKS